MAGPSGPAEGSTCLSKGPVVLHFSWGHLGALPTQPPSPSVWLEFPSRPMKGPGHLLTLLSWPMWTGRDRRADLAQETGPREPPGMGFGAADAQGTSSWWFSLTTHYRGSPQTADPALWSWRGHLQRGSVDLRIPLHRASLGDALTVPVASGNCVSSVDLIFPICKI